MFVICVGVNKQSGKDTFCNFIICELKTQLHNIHIIKRGFADKLKETCYELYNWAGLQNKEYYEKYPSAKNEILPSVNLSPRQIWLNIAKKLREYDDNIFVNATFTFDRIPDIFILSDVRFRVELEKIKSYDYHSIYLDRPGIITPVFNNDVDTLLNKDDFNEVIFNNKDKQNLYNCAVDVVKRLIDRHDNLQSKKYKNN